jgi:hypothetical protein
MREMVITKNLIEEGQKMKTKRNFTITLTVLLAIALISTSAWAKKPVGPEPPTPNECGLTGTWVGGAEGDLGWLGIHTSTDGIKGEMLMNWVDNTLFDDAEIEMAPGHGVWELIDSDTGKYSYTWYSQVKFAVTENSKYPLPIRVYGTAQMDGCDNVVINYTFEIEFEGVWDTFDTGTAYETRLKVFTPPVSE